MRPRRQRAGGFTFVELVVIMIVIGALAAVMLPRLTGPSDSAGTVYADRVLAILRLAQKTAVAHRRLVCLQTTSSAFTLLVSASNPATGPCTVALNGEDPADSATADGNVGAASSTGLIGTTLYFQPNGDITTDMGGALPAGGTINVSVNGATVRTITVEGATGYVDFS